MAASAARRAAASATTRSSSPTTATAAHDGRAHRRREGRDLPPRPRRRAALRHGSQLIASRRHGPGSRTRAARSRSSRTPALILLKIVAGVVTGSVAIITEAMHSAIDLVASIVAYVSVRKAEEPADAAHRYGHEKIENLAAGGRGDADPRRLGVIVYEAVNRLVEGTEVESIGIGIAVIALRRRGQPRRLAATSTAAPRPPTPPALAGDAAHLRTDALTSLGVLVGLVLVAVTGATWIDPVVALLIAVAIVYTGLRIVAGSWRVLVDEALPEDETRPRSATRSRRSASAAWSATTSCAPAAPAPPLRRPPRPVPRRHDARGRARDRARAAGRDPGSGAAAPTSSSTSSPRTASGPRRRPRLARPADAAV